MKTLLLDPNFNPFPKNETIAYKSLVFPGGEPHIEIEPLQDTKTAVCICHRIGNFEDFGFLLLAIGALKRMGIRSISAFIPYFPAARQDRVTTPGTALSVKVYADILNQQGLDQLLIFDPHSEVTTAVLQAPTVLSNHIFIQELLQELPPDLYIVSPDAGAQKKIYELGGYLQDYEVIEAGKKRDVKSGKLSGFRVYAEDLEGRDCLIVDDICDGGGTFIGLAAALKAKNAGNLYLAVSHGIFSKGLEPLETVFTKVYCTNSFRDMPKHPLLTQFSIQLENNQGKIFFTK
ncbi:MAG: ribose-phosphate diphosphokinase [Flavobacteriaceae bacterium]|nr:ribose-phosphate diphosphokinase [Flavobacteriaceae bacterium]